MKIRFAVAGLLVGSLIPVWASAAVPGPVVDDAWLAQHAADVTILDVGNSPQSYAAQPAYETDKKSGKRMLVEAGGHIAGASLVNTKEIRVERTINGRKVKFMIPEKAAFEKMAQAWGVKAGKPIVIVPMGASSEDVDMAARLYWQFKYYGATDIALLNGGMTAWLDAGRPVVSGAPAAPAAGDWHATKEHREIFADSADVEQAVAHRRQLVDARDLPTYHGMTKKSVVAAAGHIGNAKVYPADLVTRHGDAAMFMDAAQYRKLMTAQGINPAKPTIAYCNTGHLASGVWFTMSEIVGNKSVRLYDGSMHEWTMEGRKVHSDYAQ